MSVKNFSPELLNIFKVGSQKTFQFNCGSAKAAQALRARLHNLRREMRKEHHWLVPVAEGVVISIPKDNPNYIVAQPPDNNILDELQKALKEQGGELIQPEELNDPEKDESFPEFNRKDNLNKSIRAAPDEQEKAESAIHKYLRDNQHSKTIKKGE